MDIILMLVLWLVLWFVLKRVFSYAVAAGFLPEIWWHQIDDGHRTYEERAEGLAETLRRRDFALSVMSGIASMLAIQIVSRIWLLAYA